MPHFVTMRRVLLCAMLPLAIAAFDRASAIAQTRQTLPDSLQPAVPFPPGAEDPSEPAIAVPTAEPPAIEDPASEAPIVEDSVTADPATEDPVVEDPVVEDPAIEAPAVEIQPATPAEPPPAAASPAPPVPRTTLRRSPSPFGGSTIFENLTLIPGADPSPKIMRGISGGPISASDVAGRPETATGPCLGFVDTQPDHVLTLTAPFEFLSLQVQSAEDTTLLVRGPGGSWCNDNYLSLNPGIAGQWLPGSYEIWIGSHRNNGYFPYVIRVLQSQEATE